MNCHVLIQKNTSHYVPPHSLLVYWMRTTLLHLSTPWKEKIQAGEEVSITLRAVNTFESHWFNLKYRHKKGETNVLSFPIQLPAHLTSTLGDLIMCPPLILKESEAQHKGCIAHWAHLYIHGLLHLLNYHHDHDAEAQIMEKIEIEILQILGFANPYTDAISSHDYQAEQQ